MLLIHGSRYIYMQPSSFNKAVLCALGKVGKPRMALKDEQLMAIQHIYMSRMCLYGYRQIRQVHMYEFLPFVFVPHIHFGKAEMAYRHHGLASYVSTCCSCTLQSYILPNISPCYYLKFRLRISMNYMESVAELLTHARTVDTRCSSPIFVKCLGMRLQ